MGTCVGHVWAHMGTCEEGQSLARRPLEQEGSLEEKLLRRGQGGIGPVLTWAQLFG